MEDLNFKSFLEWIGIEDVMLKLKTGQPALYAERLLLFALVYP